MQEYEETTATEDETPDTEQAEPIETEDETPAARHIGTATYSPEDNKIRIYPFSRLSAEDYARVKLYGFKWAPKQELFVAPSWTPGREDFARRMCGQIDDEDTSLVDRAEAKAERLEDLSDRKQAEAERAREAVSRIADNIPLGQPILIGHHSERHARRDAKKIENGMRRAVECWKAAGYWTERAAGALRNAKYKERPDVRARRIKGLEADYRKEDKGLIEARQFLKLWSLEPMTWANAKRISNDYRCNVSQCFTLAEFPRELPRKQYEGEMGLWSALGDSPEEGAITPEQAAEIAKRHMRARIDSNERWIAHLENRLAYERAMLAEGGGLAAEAEGVKLEIGGRIRTGRDGWMTITKLNKKDGRIVSVTTNARYCRIKGIEEIQEYEAPSAEQAQAAQAAAKVPPLCNYPGERFATCTQAEWDKIYKDRKGIMHYIPETETTKYHRVRNAFGGFVHLPPKAGKELDPHYCDANRTHTYWPVFITDAKRKDPPAKGFTFAASLDDLTPAMFETYESGKIRAGIQWTTREDGPGGECYQFDTLAELIDCARAYETQPGMMSYALVTHSGEYKNMRPVYKWEQPPMPIEPAGPSLEQILERTERLKASNDRRAAEEAAAAPFRQLEESLKAGVTVVSAPQLFPTPPELAARMVEEAGLEEDHRVLEPSAGTGNICRAIVAAGATPVAVELSYSLCEHLTRLLDVRGVSFGSVVQGDFLEQNGNLGKFDRILMNPPFINGSDIRHIKHALTFLKPGGRLVAICANGPKQRAELMPLAENSGGWWEDLPAGTFSEQGTGVNTALLVIEG